MASSSHDSTSKAAIIVTAGASSALVAWLLYKYYNKGKPPSSSSSSENQLLLVDQLEPPEDNSFTLLPVPIPNAEPRPVSRDKARKILSRIQGQIAGERIKNQIAISSHHLYRPKPSRAAPWLKDFVQELEREEVETGSLPERMQLNADKFFKSRMSEAHPMPSSSIDEEGMSSVGNKIVGRVQNRV